MSQTPNGTAPASAPVAPALAHRETLIVLAGVMSGMFLAALDQSILGTALPRIVSDLAASITSPGSSPPTC